MRTFGQQPLVGHLKSLEQLRACTKAQLREVARLAEHVEVDKGGIVVREGQCDRELCCRALYYEIEAFIRTAPRLPREGRELRQPADKRPPRFYISRCARRT